MAILVWWSVEVEDLSPLSHPIGEQEREIGLSLFFILAFVQDTYLYLVDT